MSDQMNTHLSQEAMLRWQIGDATETERAHVAMCGECQAQTKPLSDALGWFGAAARQWGEEKAATAQEWREAKAAAVQEWREAKAAAAGEWREAKLHARRHWRPMVASWAAACLVLLLLFGFGLSRWRAHRALEAQVRQQQIQHELARDNALMEAVDQDVSQVVPEAMQPLSWNPNAASNMSTTSAVQ